ncbi:hypothetical protein Bca52824_008225 [Brassica carinata]|uniref:Uncharacterized protein n=1 Tax=Brassica carinata TaxID=52824 RepID=A0A8X8B8Z8_BRACI|nr:hypothetical protein Bca52824_008225 [Brassica carinata]
MISSCESSISPVSLRYLETEASLRNKHAETHETESDTFRRKKQSFYRFHQREEIEGEGDWYQRKKRRTGTIRELERGGVDILVAMICSREVESHYRYGAMAGGGYGNLTVEAMVLTMGERIWNRPYPRWEALALLLIGISVNQMRSLPKGATAIGIPLATGAYICTVTVPSMASVFNEYALKSQYDTSIYLQFFSPLAKVKDEQQQNGSLELSNARDIHRANDSFINMAAGANEEATHRGESDDRTPLLPR